MPNDAKLGMVLGVALVVVFAVVLFRKDTSSVASADVSRAVTPAPRMSGGRGSVAPRPINRITRSPAPAIRQPAALDAFPASESSDSLERNRSTQRGRVQP
jgi:hypothetical protein